MKLTAYQLLATGSCLHTAPSMRSLANASVAMASVERNLVLADLVIERMLTQVRSLR